MLGYSFIIAHQVHLANFSRGGCCGLMEIATEILLNFVPQPRAFIKASICALKPRRKRRLSLCAYEFHNEERSSLLTKWNVGCR